VLTLVLAVALVRTADMVSWYPVKAVLVFAAISAVAIGWLEGRHPFETFGVANWVTTFRAVLVALIAACVGEPRGLPVAAIASVGGVTAAALDGLDGWLARRTGTMSEFGARYDMEIDALLILVLALLAWLHAQAGWWILLAGLMRYGFIVAGLVRSWINAPLPPSLRRKTVCVVQIVGLAAVVSPIFVQPASGVIAALTLITLLYSFAVDVIWLRRQSA